MSQNTLYLRLGVLHRVISDCINVILGCWKDIRVDLSRPGVLQSESIAYIMSTEQSDLGVGKH